MEACRSESFREEGVYTQWLHEHATTNPLGDQRITGPHIGLTSRNQVYGHARQEIQILKVEPLSLVTGKSYLNIYVPIPPCAAIPLIHLAEPSLIQQSKQPFTNQGYINSPLPINIVYRSYGHIYSTILMRMRCYLEQLR